MEKRNIIEAGNTPKQAMTKEAEAYEDDIVNAFQPKKETPKVEKK